MHPATRTFMALRIAINDELEALDALLAAVATGAGGDAWLRPGARVGIISFHSLEDRRVKRAFADLAAGGRAERVTKKPVVASPDEIRSNPRSRSAKLRVLRIAERTTSTDGPSQDG
jgi:16S rRNA (cytosine1402-N4)-methyltransferase